MKDEYITVIKEAGFQDVDVIDETSFPVKTLKNDPTAKDFIEKFNIPVEKVDEMVSSVQSIKVSAVKPGP